MKTKERILVIDDDRRFLEEVRRFLQEEGYDVEACSGAVEGLEQLGSFAPDLLLLDWQMPQITGLEMIGKIREEKGDQDLYIIMLSGKIMTESIVQALGAGADDYMIKPFVPDELLARVQKGLRSRKRIAIDAKNRERVLKSVQKIESLSLLLSNAVARDKRASALVTDIKTLIAELKDSLRSRSS